MTLIFNTRLFQSRAPLQTPPLAGASDIYSIHPGLTITLDATWASVTNPETPPRALNPPGKLPVPSTSHAATIHICKLPHHSRAPPLPSPPPPAPPLDANPQTPPAPSMTSPALLRLRHTHRHHQRRRQLLLSFLGWHTLLWMAQPTSYSTSTPPPRRRHPPRLAAGIRPRRESCSPRCRCRC